MSAYLEMYPVITVVYSESIYAARMTLYKFVEIVTFSCYNALVEKIRNVFEFCVNFSTSVVRIIENAITGKTLVPDRREGRKTKTRE